MPTYCENLLELDGIPPQPNMQYFIPYCAPTEGCTQFDVHIKVPSACYYIASDADEPPADGACGSPGDLQHTIHLARTPDCDDASDRVLILTLYYNEDPQGVPLYIYVVDQSDASMVKGGGKTKREFVR